jgi:hypothetical protein
LVTPRTILDKIAVPHAKDVYLMTPEAMKDLFELAKGMLSTVRSTMTGEFDEELKERILSEIVSTDLTPSSIQKLLLSRPATAS